MKFSFVFVFHQTKKDVQKLTADAQLIQQVV